MTIAKPGPTPVPLTEPFWAAARRGELLLQRCRSCGHHQHYPRVLCTRCWHRELDWVPSAGKGRVWTFTVVHRPGHPAWSDDVPYALAIVELDEGPRLLTNVVGLDPADVTVGLPVVARFTEHGDSTIVQFGPEYS
ncbi:Zn-ribbon domain-containing OB-fold protein [Prauserella flavalba]|uniref:Zn-ribbon domain-containing OB-fold protein n=1 Tax=Prauserella flavalba TaxID=1477506 RepID=UPI0036E354BD